MEGEYGEYGDGMRVRGGRGVLGWNESKGLEGEYGGGMRVRGWKGSMGVE